MQVRLTRRLAECVDGIDLAHRHVGDLMDLSEHDAEMLVAEGWATAVAPEGKRAREPEPRAAADDSALRRQQRRRA